MTLPVLYIENSMLLNFFGRGDLYNEARGLQILNGLKQNWDVRISDAAYYEAIRHSRLPDPSYPNNTKYSDAIKKWIADNSITISPTQYGQKVLEIIDNSPTAGTSDLGERGNNEAFNNYKSANPGSQAWMAGDDFKYFNGHPNKLNTKTTQDILNNLDDSGKIHPLNYQQIRDERLGLNAATEAQKWRDVPKTTITEFEARGATNVELTSDGKLNFHAGDTRFSIDPSTGFKNINDFSNPGEFAGRVGDDAAHFNNSLERFKGFALNNGDVIGGALLNLAFTADDINTSVAEALQQYNNGDIEGARETLGAMMGRVALGTTASAMFFLLGTAFLPATMGIALFTGLGHIIGRFLGSDDDLGDGHGDAGQFANDMQDWANQFLNNTLEYLAEREETDLGTSTETKIGGAKEHDSPLVLDLDGNGLALGAESGDHPVYVSIFATAQGGIARSSGWMTGGDGILAIDQNNNGRVDGPGEVFGDQNGQANGFEALRIYDANKDGKIDAADNVFKDLRVWIDADADGYSDDGEMHSLVDLGITSINLSYDDSVQVINGNEIRQTGSFVINGQTRVVADVYFENSTINTKYSGSFNLDPLSLLLPGTRGYGELPDLFIAMSLDNDLDDPDSLMSMVSAFSDHSLDELLTADTAVIDDVKSILFRWAGVQDVDPDSRPSPWTGGVYVDARELEFIEKFTGQEFLQRGFSSGPLGPQAGSLIQEAFYEILHHVFSNLIAQIAGDKLFEGNGIYNIGNDKIEGYTGLNLEKLSEFQEAAEELPDTATRTIFWKNIVDVIDHAIGAANLDSGDLAALQNAIHDSDNAITLSGILDALVFVKPFGQFTPGDSGDNIILDGSNSDELLGQGGDDTLGGNEGDDYVDGGTGNDIYLYNAGDGHDVYVDVSSTSGDRIEFGADIEADDLTFIRLGNDLQILIDNGVHTPGSILIADQFIHPIEEIYFSDTTSIDLLSINWTVTGSAGADVISGVQIGTGRDDVVLAGDGNDTVNGETGDDALYGQGGNDTLNGGSGEDFLAGGAGHDLLQGGADSDGYFYDGGTDVIYDESGLADFILLSSAFESSMNVQYVRVANDLLVSFGGENNIYIEKFFSGHGIESLTFDDDTTINITTAADAAEYGTTGTENYEGSAGDDYYYGMGGQDYIQGKAGNDILYGSDYRGNYAFTGVIEGWGGNDYIYGGIGNANRLDGGGGNDFIFGGAGNDRLDGQDGNDYLDGGAGNDDVRGGLGDDVYFFSSGHDTFTDTTRGGLDTILFAEGWELSDLSFRPSGLNLLIYIDAANQILVRDFFATRDENIDFLEFSDSTVISVADIHPTVVGSEGNNNFAGLGALNGDFSYISKNDLIYGYGGNDDLNGKTGDDTLYGGSGNDWLTGHLGNDTLAGGDGDDNVVGDTGDDLYIYTSGMDVLNERGVNGGGGTDTLFVAGFDINETSYRAPTGGFNFDATLVINAGEDEIRIGGQLSPTSTPAYLENVVFSDGFTANLRDVANWRYGTESSDGITGNALGNAIIGRGGNDNLSGLDGNDNIHGGAGDDTLIGGNQNDVLFGGEGEDTLNGGAGADIINGDGGTAETAQLYAIIVSQSGAGNGELSAPVFEHEGDTVTYDDAPDGITINLATGLASDDGYGSTDVIKGIENVIGSAYADDITGSSMSNRLYGGGGDDVINAGAGTDTLDGGAGEDEMTGGTGNDVYIVDDEDDVVIEFAGGGNDTVYTSVSYELPANVETLIFTGTGSVNATGNASANVLNGTDGNNTINGGAGADILIGGEGDDVYVLDNEWDVAVEAEGEGNDTVFTSVSYILGEDLENIVLTGSDDIDATGNDLGNTLSGNSSSNTLEGAGGTDTLMGGGGDDAYIISDLDDVIVEYSDEGTDSVYAEVGYNLSTHLENLILDGDDDIDGTGNESNNVISGNAGNNTLDGAGGVDTLSGGDGDDAYIVDDADDQVIEGNDEGADVVYAGVSFVLGANIESLVLTAGGATNATGNDADNTITGNSAVNSISGLDGDDTIDGAAGADTMSGGDGNDVYYVDNAADVISESPGEGVDIVVSSVSHVLSSNVEHLTLAGSANIDGTGNSGNNTLAGNSGINTLAGGSGNDTYVVANLLDVVVENMSEGNDLVLSSVTYSLDANVESLELTGAANIDATGNSGNNTLAGNLADNTLNGQAGNDVLLGGAGDDAYYLNEGDGDDSIFDSAGIDKIIFGSAVASASADYSQSGNNLVISYGTLGDSVTVVGFFGNAHIEEVIFDDATVHDVEYILSQISGATSGDDIITGTDNTDTIDGLGGNDTLYGVAGSDTLIGGAGDDTLAGGVGDDFYSIDSEFDLILENDSEGTDTIDTSVSLVMADNVENLTQSGVGDIFTLGNALDNTIEGNSGDNSLMGGGGVDTLAGGLGDDSYLVDEPGDAVIENDAEGTDLVFAGFNGYTLDAHIENLTLTNGATVGNGNGLDNILTGTLLNDTLDGGAGSDTMIGGNGDDLYVVDDEDDQAVEEAGDNSSTDTVQSSVTYTLSTNIDHIYLTGSADIDATGNAENNTLSGNAGTNTLTGLTGNDSYVITDGNDVIVEYADEGIDHVYASINYSLADNVEVLHMTGSGATTGTGNAGNNALMSYENNAVNTLVGGAGGDTYWVGAGDVVVEFSSEGFDTVVAFSSYTLGDNVEDLRMDYATGAVTGAGNALDNTLSGNGVSGTTLAGGTGDDTYYIVGYETVVEGSGAGTDLVRSNLASYTLTAHVENLSLNPYSFIISGIGNSMNNTVTGNQFDNTLDGAAGADSLIGDAGNDIYLVDDAGDLVIESSSEGSDTVISSVSYAISDADVENLQLTGTSDIDATGNSSVNILSGNSGDNTLDGGVSADTLIGGAGNDVYIVDNSGELVVESIHGGTDTALSSVSYTLADGVEILVLTGAADIDGTGNDGDNTLHGNSGENTLSGGLGDDLIDGQAGGDYMAGAEGDDTYVVEDADDIVFEAADEGLDSVQSAITYTLGSDVENLILSGGANIDGIGNELDNILTGNSGDNTLAGGAGNDSYYVWEAGDLVVESADEGQDTVFSGISYILTSNVENLQLIGDADINAVGNDLGNLLAGNSGANSLVGGEGDDNLQAGEGDDVYLFSEGDENDVVVETGGADVIVFGSAVDSASAVYTQDGYDLVIGYGTMGDSVRVVNYFAASESRIESILFDDLTEHDLDDILDQISGATAGDDTLTTSFGLNFMNGKGGSDLITGFDTDDTLDGGAGEDSLVGSNGNDLYIVDEVDDVVIEAENEGGYDIVEASVDYTLSSNVEALTLVGSGALIGTGNDLNNWLTGNGEMGTTLQGGLGNDTYYIVGNEIVIEESASGSDTVYSTLSSYTLPGNVETLVLSAADGSGDGGDGTGNALDNAILGNSGANTLDGAEGSDYLMGFGGDDTYIIDDVGDEVIEGFGQGYDTIMSSVGYQIRVNVEHLVLTGSDAIDASGDTFANTLTGNVAANTLDGGIGADTMAGGDGDDFFVVDNAGDVVVEASSEGSDTVSADISYTLGANVENLVLTGSAALNGSGNILLNTLTGNNANNTLDGGADADVMLGDAGDDTYIVDDTGDTVIEGAAAGNDLVLSSVTYAITDADIENLTLTGSSSIHGTGNSSVNVIQGNSGNNTLDGAAGADTMTGHSGNDTYVVDNVGDVVSESSGEGTDEVRTSLTYALGSHLEHLVLTGSADINASGNSGTNSLTGNAGNNTLDGAAGADHMAGGAGHDVYIVDDAGDTITESASEGTDTIRTSISFSISSSANIEDLTLTGSGNINATGNSTANTLTGNSGNNTLDGGAGADVMMGGAGDDGYIVDNAGDTVSENASAGNDIVGSSVSYTLSANVESLILLGSSNIDGTGNSGVNIIAGNTGANTLDGGAGADTLIGGAGNDAYIVDNAGDVVSENTSGGTDAIYSSITFTIASLSEVENLSLTGAGHIDATGNAAVNVLVGNSGNNTLDGGSGADTMSGGGGDDVFIVDNASDTVAENGSEGTDTALSSVTYTISDSDVENLSLTGSGNINGTGNSANNTLTGNSGTNTLSGGAGDDTYVVGSGDVVSEGTSAGNDTVESSVTHTLSADVENLTLSGSGVINGTGNSGNNILRGDLNTSVNSLIGSTGDDSYYIGAGDIVVEGSSAGADTVYSALTSYTLTTNVESLVLTGSGNIDGTGNTLANTLTGNMGNNTLDGGTGNDTMSGGLGDDVYVANVATDVIIENSGEGTDTIHAAVAFSISSLGNIENLVMTGTGTATGNTGNNTIDGSQSANANALFGGAGDDLYILGASDTATESSGQGNDTVMTGATHTLGSYIENLILTGSSNINGTGNAEVNILTGNIGNNSLSGAAGADTMIGGAGDDTYTVDNASDVVSENAGQGIDTVIAALTHTLAADVENLTLTGTTVDGTGNGSDNVITGTSSVNTLSGLDGNDTLDGGAGADVMFGGMGDDVYIVDNASDAVSETLGGGTDLVEASVTYTLGSGLENLTLTGTTIHGTGNSGNNIITGSSSANTLMGLDGNDTIIGGGGADRMLGGTGDDVYVVSTATTVITENASEGADHVQSAVTYTLASEIENLTLTGSGGIHGTGNGLANILTGNSGANSLTGGAGNDTLDGGSGVDSLTGGLDADIFVFSNAANIDVVADFSAAQGDALDLRSLLDAYDPVYHAITDWVRITDVSGNSKLEVDRDGTGGTYGWTQIGTLTGVTGLTNEAALVTGGNLLVD